jgi:hypothetical protein
MQTTGERTITEDETKLEATVTLQNAKVIALEPLHSVSFELHATVPGVDSAPVVPKKWSNFTRGRTGKCTQLQRRQLALRSSNV